MEIVTRRRSKLAPPPGGVFAALIRRLPSWWVSVEGEREPTVVASTDPTEVTWSSPFTWRPHDTVLVRLGVGEHGNGCLLELRQISEKPWHPQESSTLRHRWGEHLDRDLRDFLDDGATRSYRFSPYRGDAEDWSIIGSLEDRIWIVTEPVWASVEVQMAPARSWMAVRREHDGERLLEHGAVVWSFALCRHRAAVSCIVQEPEQIEARLVSQGFRESDRYRGFELVIPVAVFGRQLELRDGGDSARLQR